jgi:hypothetical protein
MANIIIVGLGPSFFADSTTYQECRKIQITTRISSLETEQGAV